MPTVLTSVHFWYALAGKRLTDLFSLPALLLMKGYSQYLWATFHKMPHNPLFTKNFRQMGICLHKTLQTSGLSNCMVKMV
jgi:hypothetical protein